MFVLAGLLMCGCDMAARRAADEQKEPYFLLGKKRAAALDYKGAAEAFEKALEFNPRNASAHFELALLYEKDETDLAGAIYHFDRYLRLRPNAENTQIVKDRLLRCKQLLASTVQPVSPAQAIQRELERLASENRDLRRQLDAWQAYYTTRLQQPQGTTSTQTDVTAVAAPQPTRRATEHARTTQVAGAPATQSFAAQAVPGAPPARKHTVQQGESLYSIARKYGVKLDALQAANPGIEPRRLKIGQVLNIPAQ